ncbi:DUF2975 domain-containing protein [Pedobacter sp. HDW13]|uniref:DUF2975 domain-containing protein n=1 Tax=unclassified Pedobacter TaxID=2628915 RepID=UPI000F5AD5B9|nr:MULTISPECIES: DUF2975 domain-containing protein [unclassified Pedobacter]QIL37846.1 DUF2975 domain-containing protein [Pedobacter sp. HDW13]RQO79007.1 DUF2975 domain-containing protein [Pedobacter sp. KBW01]
MSKRNNFVFKALHVIAWVIFVGLCIEAGGLLVNFIFSVFKPEFVGNLYQKLDLSKMYQQSQLAFFGMYGFLLVVSILKAMLFYILIMLLYKLDLSNPFNSHVANKIKSIAYYTFSIGIISLIATQVAKDLQQQGYETDKLDRFWEDGQAFILMAAVVYVISQIFNRGVELQNENDLTV